MADVGREGLAGGLQLWKDGAAGGSSASGQPEEY